MFAGRDDEANIRVTLAVCLEAAGHDVIAAATADQALSRAADTVHDVVFLDMRLGATNGLDLIPSLLCHNPATCIIVITAYPSIGNNIEAARRGVCAYLPKPFTPAQVLSVMENVVRVRSRQQGA